MAYSSLAFSTTVDATIVAAHVYNPAPMPPVSGADNHSYVVAVPAAQPFAPGQNNAPVPYVDIMLFGALILFLLIGVAVLFGSTRDMD